MLLSLLFACGTCFAALRPERFLKRRKKMKTKLIVLIVTLAVAIGGGATAAVVLNTPENVAGRAISALADDFFERDEIEPISDVFSGGSLDFSLTGMNDNNGVELMDDNCVKGKLYFSDEAFMLKDFDLKLPDVELFGEVYLSRDVIYVSEENILGDTYGVDFSALADDFKGSIFAPGSDSYYELDEDVYDRFVDMFEALADGDYEKDAKKLLKRVTRDLWEIFMDNADLSKESKKIRVGGKRTELRVVSIVVDGDALKDIIADTYDYLCDSDDIWDFIEEHGDLIYSSEDETLADAYEDWLRDLDDTFDELYDEIDSYFTTLEIDIATPKMSAKLLKLEVRYNDETYLTLDVGEDGIKKSEEITLQTRYTEISYKVSDDGDEFSAGLEIDPVDGDEVLFKIEIDRENEEFSVIVKSTGYDYYTERTLKGEYSKKRDTCTIKFEDFILDQEYRGVKYGEHYTLECKLVVDTNDKMPEPEKRFKTIEDVTEKQLGKLESHLGYLFYDGSAHVHVDANDDSKCDRCRVGFSDGLR